MECGVESGDRYYTYNSSLQEQDLIDDYDDDEDGETIEHSRTQIKERKRLTKTQKEKKGGGREEAHTKN